VQVTHAALLHVGELLESRKLDVRVGTVLPLEQARAAQEMLDGTRPRQPGKIVMQIE
jgi:NADPH:quinone reductase-like Zn-dependent oxidoreductase